MPRWIDQAIEEDMVVATIRVKNQPLIVVMTHRELFQFLVNDDSWSIGECVCCGKRLWINEACFDCRSGNLHDGE